MILAMKTYYMYNMHNKYLESSLVIPRYEKRTHTRTYTYKMQKNFKKLKFLNLS